jgi:hypothetical protein
MRDYRFSETVHFRCPDKKETQMDVATKTDALEKLQGSIDDSTLKKIIAEALSLKRFQEYIGSKPNKKMLEHTVARYNNRGGKSVKNLPPPVTSKSAPVLAQEMRRIPIDLVPSSFLSFALHQYYTFHHSNLLRDCLSSLGVVSDSSGKARPFTEIAIEHRTDEALRALGNNLAGKYGTLLVKQYFAAASFVDPSLSFLSEAIVYLPPETLVAAAAPDKDAAEPLLEEPDACAEMVAGIAGMAEGGNQSADPLWNTSIALAGRLDEIVKGMQKGVVVHPSVILEEWESLFDEVNTVRLVEELGWPVSIPEIRAAAAERSRQDDIRILERAAQLQPVDTSGLSAVGEISAKASALADAMREHADPRADLALIPLFRRIVVFIEARQASAPSQDLAEVSDLQASITTEFGALSALAVVAGHAVLRTQNKSQRADADQPPLAETDESNGEIGGDVHATIALDPVELPDINEWQGSGDSASIPATPEDTGEIDSSAIDKVLAASSSRVELSELVEANSVAEATSTPVAQDEKMEVQGVPDAFESDCAEYSDFCASHWVNADGVVEGAPWVKQDAFVAALNAVAEKTLSARSMTTAYLTQLAVEALGATPTFSSQLLADAADILNGEPVSDAQTSRLSIFDEGSISTHPATRKLALVVEALAPASDLWAHREKFVMALHDAQFSHPTVTRIVGALINGAVEGAGIRVLARRQIGAALRGASGADFSLPQFVADLKEAFESLSGVTRRLRTEHCRDAWRAFLRSGAESAIRSIFKAKAGSLSPANIELAEQQVRQGAHQCFDDAGAKFEDRTRMDRAVQNIQQKLLTIRQALEDQQNRNGGADALAHFDFPSVEELEILARSDFPDAVEALCKNLLFSLSPGIAHPDPMLLTATDLMQRPALALHLGFNGPVRIQDFELDARKVVSPVEASAVLLTRPFEIAENSDPVQTIKEHIFAVRRLDVMSMYLAEQSLNSAERSRLQRQLRAEGIDRADEMFRKLNEAWFECESVGAPIANKMTSRLEEARSLLNGAEDATFSKMLMLIAWIDDLRSVCERQTEVSAASIRAKVAQRHPELLGQLDEAIAQKRFWELPVALDGIAPSFGPAQSALSARWTLWRGKSESNNVRTRERLRALGNVVGGEVASFSEAWLSDVDAEESRRHLRRMFFDFATGDLSSISKPQRRTRKDAPFDREIKQKRIVINCGSVLSMLEDQGTNPSFVPQFHSFTSIVILSAPKSTMALSTNAAAVLARWIHSEVHGDAQSNSSIIVAVLVPGISPTLRHQVMDEFQRRQDAFLGVVIDDSDVVRMFGSHEAPPADIRPFLEVIVEQFPLGNAKSTPYSSQDGQHIRREMYVGRAGDAESLALSSKYSRVFSGRKLGKSAFLKSIADKYDGRTLPSGNKLSVLFVSIAGGDSERYICDRVTRELSVRFASSAVAIPSSSEPADRLLGAIEHVIHQNLKTSILLLLDEADAFVEAQLWKYDREREKCLSFRLMKEVTQHVDSAGLPRVRVIFSGYRVTNTRDGAWANAGEVLVLPPLAPEEANKLIVAPLARLGIDAHAQADFIARRCGNQPAIINKVGDTLLKHLRESTPVSRREVLRLSNAHVVTAFNDPGIADEIRTVMFNNFQGNPVGQIVFAAMLLAFSRLAPGFELPDAENAVLMQIRAIDVNMDWLEQRDPSLTGEIERQLNDFEDRMLIRRSETRSTAFYRLQVSHSLPILLAGDLPGQIKRAIHTLRGEHGFEIQPVRGILSDAQLAAIRATDDPSVGPPLVVVTGSWPTALNDSRVGVADRVGISASEILNGDSSELKGNARAVVNAGAALVESLLNRAHSIRLVTGGIDVARRMMLIEARAGGAVRWQSLSRVSEFGVRWWFNRVRTFNFRSSEAVEKIIALTGCIPLLLELVDKVLIEQFSEEADITQAQFAAIEGKLTSCIAESARQLIAGPASVRLEKREIEVLKMLCAMAKELERFSLQDEFNEEIWALAKKLGGIECSPPNPNDAAIVSLLIKIGLLKSDDGSMVYNAGAPDPIYGIVDAL